MDDKDDLICKVHKWVDSQGYPLELRAARAFRRAGFEVHQSELYLDKKTSSWREIDLVAFAPDYVGVTRIIFSVECKSSSKPWILFTSRASTGESVYSTYALMSDDARTALAAAEKDQLVSSDHLAIFDRLKWLRKDEKTAFSFRQAFNESDPAYAALLSSSKAASHALKPGRYSRLPIFRFAFPIILIDSPLLLCQLTDENNLELTPVASGEVLFRNPDDARSVTCVRVVTMNGLPEFLVEARREIKQLKHELRAAEVDVWRNEFGSNYPSEFPDW